MKKYFAAVAFAAALSQPATAVTFTKLTTIYVGTGVVDLGSGSEVGIASTVDRSHELVPSRYALRVGEIDVMVVSDGVLSLPGAMLGHNADPAVRANGTTVRA